MIVAMFLALRVFLPMVQMAAPVVDPCTGSEWVFVSATPPYETWRCASANTMGCAVLMDRYHRPTNSSYYYCTRRIEVTQ